MEKENPSHVLVSAIINCRMRGKVLDMIYEVDIKGATIIQSFGKIDNQLLRTLDLDDTHRDLIFMITNFEKADKFFDRMDPLAKVDNPHHSIVFSIDISNFIGFDFDDKSDALYNHKESEQDLKHECIVVIVDKGNADRAIESARAVGVSGATIINAQGSGIEETITLFGIDINPEKEVVIMLAETDKVDAISKKITDDLEIEKPGKGILFVCPVNKAIGLDKPKPDSF